MKKPQRIGVIDWGAGNIQNVMKALRKVGADCSVAPIKNTYDGYDRLVLPGVGAYRDIMTCIGEELPRLKQAVLSRPTLGICLGMQILSTIGFEGGETAGLGVLDGEVRPIKVHGKIPHMGWAPVQRIVEHGLFKNIEETAPFYFMHSFEFVNYTDILGLTSYDSHLFVSAVQKETVMGVQFHPEKSGEQGLMILRNFLELEIA